MSSHYTIRAEALKTLGFEDYKAYLASDLWKGIRQRVFDRDKVCAVCRRRPAYTAHHVTYGIAVMAGKDLSQLIAICRPCHKAVEFRGDEKRTYASHIYSATLKRARGAKSSARRINKKHKPVCRCCRKGVKKRLGRDGICLPCYKSFGERVHAIAAAKDQEAMRA